MSNGRIAIAALGCGVVAAALSGCVVFKSPPTAKQIKQKPKVAIKFTICGSGASKCPRFGNSGTSRGFPSRVLLGFRAPKGTKAPQFFEAKSVETEDGAAPEEFQFTPEPPYQQELNSRAPRNRNKYKWWGFESNVIDVDGFEAEASFKVRWRLRDFDEKKFKVRPVVGAFAPPGDDPDAHLSDCGDSLYELQMDGEGDRICIDDPSPEETARHIKAKIKLKKDG